MVPTSEVEVQPSPDAIWRLEMAVYLVYGQSIAMEIEPSVTVEVEPLLKPYEIHMTC
ncbi:hypothetical protein MTR_8g073760 [Medicago truncatula]|uniref:Uncharacterized protein n=1 Tax=Medicago truncatula TaxID=3880 RepID=G7L9E9_MEDTR|nr:hypothetical protein MTR_8g073760 [Medicago truncatula]